MDAELKERWLAKLRDSSVVKGRGTLNFNDQMCCLGVLCEVLQLPRVIDGNYVYYNYMDVERLTVCLGDSLLNEIGIEPNQQFALVKLNDSNRTFKEVIEYIESKL